MYKQGMKIEGLTVGHVQGIATDAKREFMYFSCTTFLAKTDMEGNIISVVRGLTGHLGCIAYNYEDGKIYGSLEYKNDTIGKDILRGLMKDEDNETKNSDGFYVAVFDVDKMDKLLMDADSDGVMTVVHLDEVLNDYTAKDHRYGCSGIDGITFAPIAGATNDKKYLYVAYGIYSDVNRSDNDYQVILRYDIENWKNFEQTISENRIERKGPKVPDSKYFVYTGNTNYGIQNLEYDENSGYMFAAVYEGIKENFPNYQMYVIDMNEKSEVSNLKGLSEKGETLSLAEVGEKCEKTGIRGINFPHGSTGMASLGDGYFYFSEYTYTENSNGCVIGLYEFDGKGEFIKR